MKRLILLALLLLAGCKSTVTAPETPASISGRYDNENMILLLTEANTIVIADLEWMGYTTRLNGTYDRKNKQVIMSGNYFGIQNISFNLFFDGKGLVGGFNYNGSGTQAINFVLRNYLSKKHDQGFIE